MHSRHVTRSPVVVETREQHQDQFYLSHTCTLTKIHIFLRSASFGISRYGSTMRERKIESHPLRKISRYQFFCTERTHIREQFRKKKLYKRQQQQWGVAETLRDGHRMTQMVIYCSFFCTSIMLNNAILYTVAFRTRTHSHILLTNTLSHVGDAATSELIIKCKHHILIEIVKMKIRWGRRDICCTN